MMTCHLSRQSRTVMMKTLDSQRPHLLQPHNHFTHRHDVQRRKPTMTHFQARCADARIPKRRVTTTPWNHAGLQLMTLQVPRRQSHDLNSLFLTITVCRHTVLTTTPTRYLTMNWMNRELCSTENTQRKMQKPTTTIRKTASLSAKSLKMLKSISDTCQKKHRDYSPIL